MMFGSKVGFSGSADLMVQLTNVKNPRWRLTLDSWCVPRGLHTRTAVARNPCVSWAFLFIVRAFYFIVVTLSACYKSHDVQQLNSIVGVVCRSAATHNLYTRVPQWESTKHRDCDAMGDVAACEVVISGLSGRLPESDNIAEFREHLINGDDMITEDNRRWEPGES